MKQEKHELETIFWKAIDILSPSKRAEYLDSACGQDSELRTRVEKLIAAHPHAGCFLEEPSHLADISQSMPPQEKPGDILGDYKIVKQIGEGGMGVVYLAEQLQPVKRKVALKIIKAGMDSHQILSRFEAERQTLALMDHPNIARVFDAGQIENGRPFIVMELVDGIPMTDFCDRNKLDTEKKLELFSELCHGLQHAHQKGIIHRDLKPSNVLVTFIDNEPVPKIIDFGVSKALDRDLTEQTLFTTFGQLVGTPLYMSPEQAAMSGNDIDTRSDIYSMGVVLYELLTGSTPFDKNTLAKAGYDEMRRMIREDEPAMPSSRISTLKAGNESVSIDRDTDTRHLTKILRHDLDWIVMKALEKERDRRYQTVADFAQDIDRFLDNQPVEARPPSTVYRLKKYCKRNKTFVTASVFVVIAILSGSGVSIWQSVIAHQRFLSEKTARAEAEQERERAALALIQTRKTIDNYVKTVQNAELLRDPRFRPLMKKLMKDALQHYQSLISTFEMDNKSLLELSEVFHRIGWINGRIGENETAMVAYHKSIDIQEKLIAEEPDRLAYQTELAASYHNVGSFYDQKGEFDEALNFFQKATESWSRVAALKPKKLEYQRNLAGSHNNIGDTLLNQGKMQEALEHFTESKSIIDEIVKLEPSTTSFREILVTTLHNIGRSYRNFGKTEKALENYRKAATNAEFLIEKSSGEREHYHLLSTTLNEIGTLLSEIGKLQDCINTLEKALEISEELVRKFPNEMFYASDLASLHNNLANVYAKVNRDDLATKSYRRSMVLCEKLVNEDPVNIAYQSKLATIQNNLGNQFSRNKDFVSAEKFLKMGLEGRKRLAENNPSIIRYRYYVSRSQANIGRLLIKSKKRSEAIPFLIKAIDLRTNIVKTNPAIVSFHRGLENLFYVTIAAYRNLDQPEKSIEKYNEGIAFYRQLVETQQENKSYRTSLGNFHYKFANFHNRFQNIFAAVDAYRDAIAVLSQLAEDYPKDRVYREFLGKSYYEMSGKLNDLKKYSEAIVASKHAFSIRSQLANEYPATEKYQIDCATNLNVIAVILENLNKNSEALDSYRRGREYIEELLRNKPENQLYKRILTINLMNGSNLLEDSESKMECYNTVIALLEPVMRANPKNQIDSKTIYRGYSQRARLFNKMERYLESANDWKSALKWCTPQNRAYIQKQIEIATEKAKNEKSSFDKPLVAPRPIKNKGVTSRNTDSSFPTLEESRQLLATDPFRI